MTEQEWLACADPKPMLEFLEGKASNRKLWLFVCGGCRRHALLLADARCRTAVEVSERFADGEASSGELEEASDEAFCGRGELSEHGVEEAIAIAAACAVVDPAGRDPNLGVITTMESVQNSSSDLINIAEFSQSAEVERAAQCRLLRCIFGNPFRPVTLDPEWLIATKKARMIYEERSFDQMPELADALEVAGCTNEDILAHCRMGNHVRGYWVVDLILGKE